MVKMSLIKMTPSKKERVKLAPLKLSMVSLITLIVEVIENLEKILFIV